MTESSGLAGEPISPEELAQLPLFQGGREFRARLYRCFHGDMPPSAGNSGKTSDPPIRAAVRRTFANGETICQAGSYGATAFLLLEGYATAEFEQHAIAPSIRGRTQAGLNWLKGLVARRTPDFGRSRDASPVMIGEITAWASLGTGRPDDKILLEPGALFGIDACINAYPRERTVRATADCVVIEMLRSVLDAIRFSGKDGDTVSEAYRREAIATFLSGCNFSHRLDSQQFESLVGACDLLLPGAAGLTGAEIYREGSQADAVYFVRAGNVRLSRVTNGSDATLTYVARGGAIGWEGVFPRHESPLELECVSPPGRFPSLPLTGEVTLGRKAGCTIRFPKEDDIIGREHCRLHLNDGEWYLSRWNTQSPTYLNEDPVEESIVLPGDRIRIGAYTFEIRSSAMDLTISELPRRRTTATGLDNFEVVRVPNQTLRTLAERDDGLQLALQKVARSLNATSAVRPAPPTESVPELVDLGLYNSQNVLLIDLDRCTRCDECVRACADAHGGVARFTRDGPRLGRHLVTMACRSCTDPKCMIGCPVGSIRRLDSLEIRIEDWCIGCQSCARQCPFGNINMVDLAGDSNDRSEVRPTPTTASISTLRATVCDLCAGYSGPNCVYACPHDAAIRVEPAIFLAAHGAS